jgi:hypothetical protein
MRLPFIMDEYPYSKNYFQMNTSHLSNQDFWEEDGVSLTGNPNSSPDTLVIGSRLPGAEGQDHINFINQFTLSQNEETGMLNLTKTPVMNESTNHLWKYNEDKILKDIQDYVTSTYGSHYCGHNQEYKGTQTIDLMAAKNLAAHFCQANILKYGSRYGDKDGRNKRDLLKVIHYAMLLLHFDGHYSRKDNGLSEFR